MGKYLRVLIIRNAYQKDTGGAEQYSYNLALAFKKLGHRPYVITKHAAIHAKCRESGIKSTLGPWKENQGWTRWYYLRKPLTTLWYLYAIIRYRIDVVNPQSRDDFVFATAAAKILHKRCIWTDHADLKYIMDRENHPHPRMQAWMLKASEYASKIVCVSDSETNSIKAVAPELSAKLITVHNGVFKPEGVKAIIKDAFVIGTNARLVPEKGIKELMLAFKYATKQTQDMELWLVGGLSGNEELFSKIAQDLEIADRTKFVGYVANPNDYVASMDIFVHASYHEAFSLAIIEACMLGRPIVATSVGGTPEIITDKTGILVPPKDSEALGLALVKLLKNDTLRVQLGEQAQATAFDEFDFDKIVEEKLQPIYEGAKS